MESAVKLIIKAPNQQVEDQIISCELGWTIGRLKDYLSEVYPSKPVSFGYLLFCAILCHSVFYCFLFYYLFDYYVSFLLSKTGKTGL